MVDVKIKIALGLIAILIFAAPIAIAQEVPAHVVISEVYPYADDEYNSEWIELYNPTAENVNIGGWTIDTATKPSEATIPDVMIPAHGFYLIADKGFSTGKDDPSWPDADLEDEIYLRNGDGWCRLNNSGNFVDTVGWGTATTNETQNAVKPAKGESIERKPLGGGYAPCQDTDDNSLDFFVQDTPTPKNSSSLETGISVTKEGNVTEAKHSTNVNFTIVVTNTGDCILNPVKVVDTLPTGMSYVSSYPTADTTGGTTIWHNVSSLASGDTETIYLVAHIDSDATGILNNTVNSTGTPLAGDDVSDEGYAEVKTLKPAITVTKTASPTAGAPSTNVNFTIVVTNTGDCILNPVKVEDTLPTGMSYVSSHPTADTTGGTTIWNNVSSLASGETKTIYLVAHIDSDATGILNNTVNGTGMPLAGDNVTDSATADVTVLELDVVVISEVFYDESGTDNNEFCVLYNPTDSEIDIGDWTLKAFDQTGVLKTTTTFPDDATINAHMFYLIGKKDPLNSGDWGGTAMSPDCLRGGNDWQNGPDDYLVLEDSGGNYIDGVRWGHEDGNNPPAIPDVPDNNTAPDAAAGESIERKTLGGGYAPCQDTDNNSFDFVVQETPTPKNSSTLETGISVTKVGDVTEAKPSTLVNFNITINNTGNCTLTQVVVKDDLPQGMTFSSSVPAPNTTQDGMDITWYFNGSLAANLSKTIKLVVEIEEDAEGVLNNTVTVTGTPENATNVSASATAQIRVIRVAIEKSCTLSVSLGGTVTYTITYSNPGGTNLTNVVITENYPAGLTFSSADPAPDTGTNNTWTIGTLPADGPEGKITIKMKVPASTWDFSYEEKGSVVGEGIVMISKEMSTEQKPYKLENRVTISGSYNDTNVSATASAITTVSASGSSLEITEHGSGTYESEEKLNVDSKNRRIKYDKTTNAKYSPTTFKCSDGFVMEVPSKWSQDICIKNYAKEIAIHKTITAATTLEDETKIDTKNNRYSMKFDSKFLGYLHVGKKTEVAATSEHYIGEFEITSWDQGGKGIVDGVGYVIVDKDLDSGRLLLMEHGSGSYESEEDSSSRKIEKNTYAVYEPTQFNFSDSFVVNFSSTWMQDFCTRNRIGTVVLHKKIRDATIIDDETIAKSTPSQNYRTSFYGAFHWGELVSKARTSNDYIGSFYIQSVAETNRTEMFEWGKVPGKDEHQLKRHLKEHPFDMEWVEDAEFTKSYNNRTINITDTVGNHSAEIILSADNETAVLKPGDGRVPFEFTVESEKNGKELYVYYTKLVKVTDRVMGEGFVMVDEYVGGMHLIEHGSGIYYSDEKFVPSTIYKYTYAKYMPTYFKFADSFAVNFSSLWVQDICVKNKDEGTAIHKRISNAAFMKDDTTATKSSKSTKTWKSTKSLMNITSSFNGSMHIGARAEDVGLSEDYIGEFNVTELIEIVKKEPKSSSSETSNWLFCPFPIVLTSPPGARLSCPFPIDLSSTSATSHGLHSHWPWSCPSHWNWAPP